MRELTIMFRDNPTNGNAYYECVIPADGYAVDNANDLLNLLDESNSIIASFHWSEVWGVWDKHK